MGCLNPSLSAYFPTPYSLLSLLIASVSFLIYTIVVPWRPRNGFLKEQLKKPGKRTAMPFGSDLVEWLSS